MVRATVVTQIRTDISTDHSTAAVGQKSGRVKCSGTASRCPCLATGFARKMKPNRHTAGIRPTSDSHLGNTFRLVSIIHAENSIVVIMAESKNTIATTM